jgi:hypothetical protein
VHELQLVCENGMNFNLLFMERKFHLKIDDVRRYTITSAVNHQFHLMSSPLTHKLIIIIDAMTNGK